MSKILQKSVAGASIGFVAGIAIAYVYALRIGGGFSPRTSFLVAAIAAFAFIVTLRLVLRRSWRDTAILAIVAFAATYFFENMIVRDEDRYTMAYMQQNLILTRLGIPILILAAGSFLFLSLRSLKAWAIVLGAAAAANVLGVILFGAGDYGAAGWFPFGAIAVLPEVALLATLTWLLSDEAA